MSFRSIVTLAFIGTVGYAGYAVVHGAPVPAQAQPYVAAIRSAGLIAIDLINRMRSQALTAGAPQFNVPSFSAQMPATSAPTLQAPPTRTFIPGVSGWPDDGSGFSFQFQHSGMPLQPRTVIPSQPTRLSTTTIAVRNDLYIGRDL